MKIKAKLILVFSLIAIVPMLVLVGTLIQENKKELYNQISEKQLLIVTEKANQIKQAFHDIESDLQTMSLYPPIQGIIRSRSTGYDPLDKSTIKQWKDRLSHLFITMLKNHKMINQIRYIDLNGQELVRANATNGQVYLVSEGKLQNKSQRPYFQTIVRMPKNHFFVSQVDYNQEFGQVELPAMPVFRVGLPIYNDQTGEVYGVLVANININQFLKGFVKPVANYDYVILNQKGEFLYHPNPELTLAYLKGGSDQGQIVDLGTFEQIQNKDSSFDYNSTDKKFRSWKKIYYNSSYPSFYWVFVSISDEAVVFKPIQAMLHRSILLIVVFILLVAIAGYIMADSISRPILALTQNARLISKGNHNVTFNKVRANDEIKELSESFEGMVSSLKEANARFSSIVTYAVDGILTIDTNGLVQFANPSASQLFGYQPKAIQGLAIQKIIPDIMQYVSQLHDSEGGITISQDVFGKAKEMTGIKADGKQFSALIAMSHFVIEEKIYCSMIIHDLSELNENVSQVKKMNSDLTKINSELESFTQVISTDLYQDLQDLYNKAKSLHSTHQSQLSGEAQNDLQHIIDQVSAVNQVIHELADLTQLNFNPHLYKQVDLNEIMNVVMDEFSEEILKRDIQVTFDNLPVIEANPDHIIQLFKQILDNSLKFARDDIKPDIYVDYKNVDANSIQLIFKDNGIGIDKKWHESIFKPFYKVEQVKKYSGVGIGLSICKKIIENYQGHILIKSEEQKGTELIITLPLKQQA